MKIYIAARFRKKEEVANLYKLVVGSGHKIAGDWTLHKPIKPYEQNQALAKRYSVEDVEGVRNSDVFVLLSDNGGRGAHVELGVAILANLVCGKPKIYVVGEHASGSMFYFHPAVNRRENLDQVLREIKKFI